MRLVFLFLFSIGLAYGQSGREQTVGYADRYDSLPQIRFQLAEKRLYEKAAPAPKMVFSNAAVEQDTLIVPTAKGTMKLKKYDDSPELADGFRGWQYRGYFPLLKMHAIESHNVSENIGFSDLVLVDSITGDQYGIVSIGDAAVELPVHSPGGSFLAYFYNHVYERNSCFIGILEISDSRGRPGERISEMASFQTKDWAVEEIRWIDRSSLIVKAYTVKGQGALKEKQYAYYIASLDSGAKKTE
jgi:hypothetical protein